MTAEAIQLHPKSENEIQMYLHCKKCGENTPPGMFPSDYQEIEVTEDMVSAGMDYLMGLDPERDPIDLVATRIYRAMRQIRIAELENSANLRALEQCEQCSP